MSSLNLSPNALKVLERRYLKKDEQGQVVETPDEDVPPRSWRHCLCREALRNSRAGGHKLRRGLLRHNDQIGIYTEFSMPDECGKRFRTALSLFYPAYL